MTSAQEPQQWSRLYAEAVPRLKRFAAWVATIAPDVKAEYFAMETVPFPLTLTCSFLRGDGAEELLVVEVSIEEQADATTARVDVSTGPGKVLVDLPPRSFSKVGFIPHPQDEDLILKDLQLVLDEAQRSDSVRGALG